MKTLRLTMAQAVVEFLKKQYARRDGKERRFIEGVFGIFGHGNVAGLGQALEERGGKDLPFHQPKNEQGMVHAAAAFAKARRRLGALACTTSIGPGAANMVTGAAGATINRVPVLLLPGDIFASRRPAPVLQQLESPFGQDASVNDCLRPVSRYWDRISRPEQLLTALPEALRVITDPCETGAVTLCLPQDVQAEACEYPAHFFEKRVHNVPRTPSPAEALKAAAALIRKAKRPFLIAGGGVFYSEAEAALKALVQACGVPVGVTQAGKGVLADAHPLCLGAVGATGTSAANRIAAQADLVLCVGTRLSDFTTASKTQFQNPKVRFVSINVNAMDACKHGALPLVGDARAVLLELAKHLGEWRAGASYRDEVAQAKKEWGEQVREITTSSTRGLLSQAEVIGVLNQAVGRDSTIVHAAGGLPGDLHKLWLSRESGDYHSEYGFSCMGYEIAGALGVKLAEPKREVYAVVGDGSYLMLNSELATSIQEGLKITVILLDNHGYQCIHNLQRACGGESFGNEFRRRDPRTGRLTGEPLAIDYAAHAASLGARTWTAMDRESLDKALEEARAQDKTSLIYVPVETGRPVAGFSWWDVPVAEVSGSDVARRTRREYEAKRKAQRLYL